MSPLFLLFRSFLVVQNTTNFTVRFYFSHIPFFQYKILYISYAFIPATLCGTSNRVHSKFYCPILFPLFSVDLARRSTDDLTDHLYI